MPSLTPTKLIEILFLFSIPIYMLQISQIGPFIKKLKPKNYK